MSAPMKHLWDWHMPMAQQARCWCRPFLDPMFGVGEPGGVAPLVYHRYSPGYVFHEHGEQGPLGPECVPEDPSSPPQTEPLPGTPHAG